jgi:ABC-2 type transport system ATP-binding protein
MSIDIRQITKYYGKQKVLGSVSFRVGKGEVTGFLGPNGAGKSTLMKIVTGSIAPDQGEVLINGRKITVDNPEIKKEIGYLPENNPLYPDLYIRECLEIAAGFYQIPRPASRIMEIIRLTGLESEKNKKIGALSKGYRQRVGLAQALVHDPSVLVLDEPTSGLDPNQVDEIRMLVSQISHEKTVLMSSHVLGEIEAVCNRVVIINRGQLVADSPITSLKKNQVMGFRQVFVQFDKPVTGTDLFSVQNVLKVMPENSGWLVTAVQGADIRPDLFRYAVDHERIILSMIEKQQDLDSIFRQLTHE